MPEMTPDDILLAEFVEKTKNEKGLAEVRAAANGKGRRATIARAALRQKGGAEGQANFPSGSTEMAGGGMAYGRGGRQYQHNYATGGKVVDHIGSKK